MWLYDDESVAIYLLKIYAAEDTAYLEWFWSVSHRKQTKSDSVLKIF